MNKSYVTILLIYLLIFSTVQADITPNSLEVPGGVVIIPLSPVNTPMPTAYFNQQKVLITQDQQHWLAIVGIPLSIQPGEHFINIEDKHQKSNISFNVLEKQYPDQYITIKKKRMVSGFTDQDLAKINADKVHMIQAKKTWSENLLSTDFISPVDGRLSSLFGLKRYFNNIPKKPHNGLDIAAPTGTPVIAPATGIVINTGNYYFNGNTVFLDHGQGLLSAYLHLDEIKVTAGQTVNQGQLLGTVGETGRVTGPHLHWIVYLNNTEVDPALFITQDIPRLDARNYQ